MSMSIGASAAVSTSNVTAAVATTSLAQTKERGREAVDLIKSATSNRLLSVYA